MNNDLATLAALGVTRTRFTSVVLKPSDAQGVALGQGSCKAVILRANYWQTLSGTALQGSGDPNVAAYFYYGDANQQTFEYLIGVTGLDGSGAPYYISNPKDSELIICTDLNEVWLKLPASLSIASLEVQALIYE